MLSLTLLLLCVQSLIGQNIDPRDGVVIKPRDIPVQSLRMTSDDMEDDDDYPDDDDSIEDDDISDIQGDRSLLKEKQVDALPCKGKDRLKFGEMTAIEGRRNHQNALM